MSTGNDNKNKENENDNKTMAPRSSIIRTSNNDGGVGDFNDNLVHNGFDEYGVNLE